MWFLVFMYVSSFVLLVAYALRFKWIRIEISPWLFVFEAGPFLIYTRWLSRRTVDSFNELQKKEGLLK
jgi:hypothetical protein